MERKKIWVLDISILLIAIIWGAIHQLITKNSLLGLFIKDYFDWIISLKELFSNSFYLSTISKILFLIKTGYYILFSIAIISLIVIGIIYIIQNKSANNKFSFKDNLADIKPKNELDELINRCNDKLEVKNITEAKNIYREIKEKTKDKNYSKEQYEKIIELYKKLTTQ